MIHDAMKTIKPGVLISHSSKIITIKLGKIEKIQGSLSDNQFGFKKRIGTTEVILALAQLL